MNNTFPGVQIYNENIPLPTEQSFIENILRMNIGKKAKVYMTYPDSENKDVVYEGIIEQAGRDHIILSNPQTGKWYILLMIYLDYVTFDEKINYNLGIGPKL